MGMAWQIRYVLAGKEKRMSRGFLRHQLEIFVVGGSEWSTMIQDKRNESDRDHGDLLTLKEGEKDKLSCQ